MRTVETLDGKLERMKWENGRLEIEVAHLKAENARYREALEFLAEGRISATSIKYDYIDQAYQEIAREALKGE